MYAEQGMTLSQNAQAKACMRSAVLVPPDEWNDHEGSGDCDVQVFFQVHNMRSPCYWQNVKRKAHLSHQI